MIVLAAGRRASGSGSPRPATRSSATCSSAVLDGRGEPRASTSAPIQQRRRPTQVLDDPRVTRGKDAGGRPRAPRRRAGEPRRRDVVAVGVAEDGRRGRRPVRRRGRPDLARQRRRDGAARPTASSCSATRSSSTSRSRARTRPAPTGRRWPTSSATHATMPPDRGLFLEHDLAPPPGPLRVHVRGLLRRPPRARAAPRTPARPAPARASSTAPARGCSRCATIGRRQRVAGRGGARSRRSRASIVEGGIDLDRRDGATAARSAGRTS